MDRLDLGASSRHEKSLGLLTTKFVSLLQEAKDGVLDLKVAADQLAVRQKRRIYDITNVLEGIGLIEKKSKNSIQWKGAGPGCNTQEVSDRLETLKSEIVNMTRREAELDLHRSWIQQSLRNISEDSANKEVAYVTHKDICGCFEDNTLMAVQAPNGTNLEVPTPETTEGQPLKYQIHLKSHTGSIYVVLVNLDADSGQMTTRVVPSSSAAPVSTSTVISTAAAPADTATVTQTVTAPITPTVAPAPVLVAAAAVTPAEVQPEKAEIVAEPMVVDESPPTAVLAKPTKKETPPAVSRFVPSKVTTRALAIKMQQEKEQEQKKAVEPKFTRTFAKTVTRSVAAAAKEVVVPMEVSPVSSPTQRRQSPRKAVQLKVAARLQKAATTPVSVSEIKGSRSASVTTSTHSTTKVVATAIVTPPAVSASSPAPVAKLTTPVAAVNTTITKEPIAPEEDKIDTVEFLKGMDSDMFFDSNSAEVISTLAEDEYLENLIASEMFAPLLRLSPPPSDRDYYFNMEDSEGLCDLYDVPLLTM